MSAARLAKVTDEGNVSKGKRLVFISASKEDYAWRDRLKAKLDNYPDIEWWDHSRIPFAGDLIKEIKAAMNMADVAVVLISNAYLSSVSASSELLSLREQAEAGKLKLFPIVIEEVEEQEHYALQDFPIWALNNVIGLKGEFLEAELGRIAKGIRDAAWTTNRNRKRASKRRENQRRYEFNSSETAAVILELASSLAEKSGRAAVTSSCLLFAFAERSVAESATARFVHDLLHSSKFYMAVFDTFLKEGPDSYPTIADDSVLPWKLSLNAQSILQYASYIATRVSGAPKIHTRHLFGAILAAPEAGRAQAARIRLNRMGLPPIRIRADFKDHLRVAHADTDNQSEWDVILGLTKQAPPEPEPEPESEPQIQAPDQPPVIAKALDYQRTYSAFVPDRAAYHNRPLNAPLDDALGVGVHAGHLAQLIAARDTFMPLSIGLFGSWGAGKSYFMDLLDEQLRMLMKQPGQVFYQQIVQIKFNAWHYLDTNLWANLVSEIFDQLFTKLDERKDTTAEQVATLKKQLANQSALAAEARAALVTAENARKEAEEKLRLAIQARAAEENKVKTLLDDLKNLAINDDVRTQLTAVAEGLGWPKLESSFDELETRADEVRSLGGRTRALALSVFTGPGSWRRALLLAAALVLPMIVAAAAAYGNAWMKDLLAGSGRTITQLVLAIGALSTWLAAKVKAGNTLVAKLESSYDEVKKVRARRESQDDAAKAQKTLAAKQHAEDEARHTLHQAEEKMKLIRAELTELAPGRQLIRFLKQRASAEDYRRHLGLVSLVRRDFEQLSKLLMQSGEATDVQLPKIDRIVLYIDDLDRCRADRVVEVLEAVHLLLAFPLFAVVVAVDPRWLRQSLLDHYPRLLGGAYSETSTQRDGKAAMPATPQDYLEKIFQVPFHLEAMEKTGFEALVKELFPVRKTVTVSSQRVAQEPVKQIGGEPFETPPSAAGPESTIEEPEIQAAASDVIPATADEVGQEIQIAVAPDPQRLTLTKKEVEDVQRFQLLFATPRAVKRFANTYSLIRVGVNSEEWSDYLGVDDKPGTYRVPLLLLAVTSAFPVLARPWLLWLKETPPEVWQLNQHHIAVLAGKYWDTTNQAEWERLCSCLSRLTLDDWPLPEPELLVKWVPRVARYSF